MRIVSVPALLRPQEKPTERYQVVEPEEESEDAVLDEGEEGAGDDVSEMEPVSFLAGVFSDPPSVPSLDGLTGCFTWLGSFNLLE